MFIGKRSSSCTRWEGLANPVFGGDLQIDPHADATEDVTGAIMREHEVKVSTLFRDTSQYPVANTATLTGNQRWNIYTFVTPGDPYSIVSNPVQDLRHACQVIYLATLRWPRYSHHSIRCCGGY